MVTPARWLHLFPTPLLESQTGALNTIFLPDFTRILATIFTICFAANLAIVFQRFIWSYSQESYLLLSSRFTKLCVEIFNFNLFAITFTRMLAIILKLLEPKSIDYTYLCREHDILQCWLYMESSIMYLQRMTCNLIVSGLFLS